MAEKIYKKVVVEKKYTSIQITQKFKEELKKCKDKNHFDSYESTIKYLINKGD